jgi:hypothetical protein
LIEWCRSSSCSHSSLTVDFTAPDGSSHSHHLAERTITLPVPGQHATAHAPAIPARTVTLQLIIRASPDGHQTPILTSRNDLTTAEIAYRMSNRWRQENYFKYAREHFALDALDSYADHPDDLDRMVPNPPQGCRRGVPAVLSGRPALRLPRLRRGPPARLRGGLARREFPTGGSPVVGYGW